MGVASSAAKELSFRCSSAVDSVTGGQFDPKYLSFSGAHYFEKAF